MSINQTPPEVVEQWRAEFEPLIADLAKDKNYEFMQFVLKKFVDGSYSTTWVDMAWQGFLLGRQTVCIELPSAEECATDKCSLKELVAFDAAVSICEAEIIKQGYQVRVKGE